MIMRDKRCPCCNILGRYSLVMPLLGLLLAIPAVRPLNAQELSLRTGLGAAIPGGTTADIRKTGMSAIIGSERIKPFIELRVQAHLTDYGANRDFGTTTIWPVLIGIRLP